MCLNPYLQFTAKFLMSNAEICPAIGADHEFGVRVKEG
jgi:hypothetical protein